MRVLIAAGGTAGHINPALAIAGALKKADPTAEIHFAGRKEGMEYRLVTQAGYPFHHIEITGFQRKLSLHNIKRNIITLWNLALSGPKAKAMMKEVKPDLVIGCGGYVSGPVVRCAAKMGIHTALHEQNAFPGVTNKLLAPDVDIVFAAVPAAVEKLGAPDKTLVVGNPVRPEVFVQAANREAIRAQLGAGDRTVILSFGGSLGARRVNEVVADLCAWEQHEHKPVLHLHATGQYGVQLFEQLQKQKGFAPSIYIYDSMQVSYGLSLMVVMAAALADKGLPAVAIISELDRTKQKIGVYFLMQSLKNAKKGGRVGAIRTLAADILGVKPLLVFRDGLVRDAGIMRNYPEGLNAIVEKYRSGAKYGGTVFIFHTDDLPDAQSVATRIREIDPAADIHIEWVGAAIGIYTGRGCVGISFIEK